MESAWSRSKSQCTREVGFEGEEDGHPKDGKTRGMVVATRYRSKNGKTTETFKIMRVSVPPIIMLYFQQGVLIADAAEAGAVFIFATLQRIHKSSTCSSREHRKKTKQNLAKMK